MPKPSFLLMLGCGVHLTDGSVRIDRQITRIVPVTAGFDLPLPLGERDIPDPTPLPPDPQLGERARERSPPASQDG